MTQARDRFQAGVANNIEVITAQDALARANDNQIVALYRYNQARADLAPRDGPDGEYLCEVMCARGKSWTTYVDEPERKMEREDRAEPPARKLARVC